MHEGQDTLHTVDLPCKTEDWKSRLEKENYITSSCSQTCSDLVYVTFSEVRYGHSYCHP